MLFEEIVEVVFRNSVGSAEFDSGEIFGLYVGIHGKNINL